MHSASRRSVQLALSSALLVHPAAARSEDAEPAEDAGVDEPFVPTAPDESPRHPESIFFVGHWPKHRTYVACSSTERSEGEECWSCAVLPPDFSRFDFGEGRCGGRLAVFGGASAGLRTEAARFSAGTAEEAVRRLVALGVRELPGLALASCGLQEKIGTGYPGMLPLHWHTLGDAVEAGMAVAPRAAVREQAEQCYALDDGTFAVSLDRLLEEDPWDQEAALARARPPSRAAVETGWLGWASVGPDAFYWRAPYVAPVGFSRAGRFGWLVARAGGRARLTIVDLVKDVVFATKEWPFSGEKGVDELEGAVVREVKRAGLEPPLLVTVQGLPLRAQGDDFDAHFRPEAGGGCGVYLEGRRAGTKRIALLDPAQARRDPRIYGVVVSPFEKRVAVGVSFSGGANPDAPREVAFFGAHLAGGFEPRKGGDAATPAGTCGGRP